MECLFQTSFDKIAKEILEVIDTQLLLKGSMQRLLSNNWESTFERGLIITNRVNHAKVGWLFNIYGNESQYYIRVKQLSRGNKDGIEEIFSGEIVDQFIKKLRSLST